MNGQDVLDLVPGRPLHDEIAQATRRRDRINEGMAFAEQARRQVPAYPPPYPCGYGERDALV